jgi:putative solute:sodium symporter small subunit
MKLGERHQAYWRKNLILTGVLLMGWLIVTVTSVWFARELNEIQFIGPLGYYMGAQGALVIYIAIIGYYARRMNQLDREYGVQERDE